MANISYKDFKIENKGRTYYLRKKLERRGAWMTLTIRTQRAGKGTRKAQVKGNIRSQFSEIELLHKLYKKFKFQFVILQDIPELPK